MDHVYSRSALAVRSARGKVFKVFEGVSVERKEGEAVVDAGVIVIGIERESSFEGSSCGAAMLGFFNHTKR
jgi:hypothetical protein